VVGEQPAEPERVVAEVGAHEQAAARVRGARLGLGRGQQFGERLVDLVVGVGDACARSRSPKWSTSDAR
jgi:hypothetical protein